MRYNVAQYVARGRSAYLRRGEWEKKSSHFCNLLDRQPVSTTYMHYLEQLGRPTPGDTLRWICTVLRSTEYSHSFVHI